MFSCFAKVFGNFNTRMIKKYEKVVKVINSFEEKISSLSDSELKHKTLEFKERLAAGATLDSLLPEAFAVVREASKRVLGMRHFDVQLIGGMVLHDGRIAEMKTGEGKTLVATLAVYLNALSGKGVHVVTVNDYLAKRDANWMGQIYKFLGLSVSTIVSGMYDSQKREAYASDIVYGTNHEFGFDYLRDNLKFKESDMVMRPFNFAVIDEVDSILIDEARTPLIISGSDNEASSLYILVNHAVKDITNEDFEKDEKSRIVTLTDKGVAKLERKLGELGLLKAPGLYDVSNISIVYHVTCALKAHKLFSRDVDYMVRDGQVMIIDEFTGRMMEGRRYSEGLHQAIEAKEGVDVQTESQTIATISYQNLFRLYPKLSGMTGTAMTEEAEFDEIYKLKVVSVPSHRPVVRKDHEDSIFISLEEKDRAVLALIKECVERQQPVLVGTTSLERSEYISGLLMAEGIKHNVLNAKHHEREAHIISEAGTPGAVTIATNMAGRGTDIKLGGCVEMRAEIECQGIDNPEELERKIKEIKADVERKHKIVVAAGGLFVIGTERNDSRRIDNQLRGRSGRQGDPGASKYFLSLEDDLIRKFGSPNFARTLQKMGIQKDEDLTHRWISKAIEKAQQRVEAYNFDIRKQLLRFDDVMNDQRKIIYEQRLSIMKAADISEFIKNTIDDALDNAVSVVAQAGSTPMDWNLSDLAKLCKSVFNINIDIEEIERDQAMTPDLLRQLLEEKAKEVYDSKVDAHGKEIIQDLEKNIALSTLDKSWRTHLLSLEHLRRGINLTAYAQKNPLNEYKFEAFNLFHEMLNNVKLEILAAIFHLAFKEQEVSEGGGASFSNKGGRPLDEINDKSSPEHLTRDLGTFAEESQDINSGPIAPDNISRNALCFCGSGKKYKHCHGSLSKVAFAPPREDYGDFEADGDFDDREHYEGDSTGLFEDNDFGKGGREPHGAAASTTRNSAVKSESVPVAQEQDVAVMRKGKSKEESVAADDLSRYDGEISDALKGVTLDDLIDISEIGGESISEYITVEPKPRRKPKGTAQDTDETDKSSDKSRVKTSKRGSAPRSAAAPKSGSSKVSEEKVPNSSSRTKTVRSGAQTEKKACTPRGNDVSSKTPGSGTALKSRERKPKE